MTTADETGLIEDIYVCVAILLGARADDTQLLVRPHYSSLGRLLRWDALIASASDGRPVLFDGVKLERYHATTLRDALVSLRDLATAQVKSFAHAQRARLAELDALVARLEGAS